MDPAATVRGILRQALPENRTRPQRIYLDDPALLYLTDIQADRYLAATGSEAFQDRLFKPLRSLIDATADQITSEQLPPVDFIDLGPGHPDKSLPLVESIGEHAEKIRYVPVDLNAQFLTESASYMSERGYPALPVRALFSELPDLMRTRPEFIEQQTRIFNIGVTFCNFPIRDILNIFVKLLSLPGRNIGVIASETTDGQSPHQLCYPYATKEAADFNFALLAVAEIPRPATEYYVAFDGSRVEMGFDILEQIQFGPGFTDVLLKGDRVVTSVSYRYGSSALTSQLEERFERVETYLDSDILVARIESPHLADNA